jgi:bifunctional non-homologous end joining protein LigD
VSASARAKSLPVTITHPDRVLFPGEGYTKMDLALFYDRVFEKLRPWIDGRLLSLERCPQGIRGECFYQKEAPRGLPPKTPTKAIQHEKRVTRYVVGGRRETQLALANFGCIAVHVWGSRADAPRKPDWVCFDLDPGTGGFSAAIAAALRVREALEALRLTSYVKTSGGKGLHVFIPIRRGPDADEVLGFARALGGLLAQAYPEELTDEVRIASRRGRLYLDPARNGFAQTVVTPYSVRARPHALVSTPLDWSEVRASLDPGKFHLGNFQRRLAQGDPWEGFWRRRQALPRLRPDSLRM